MLDQRLAAVHHDLDLVAGRLLHLLGEGADVLGVKLAVDVGRRHVPLVLGVRRAPGCGERERGQNLDACMMVGPLWFVRMRGAHPLALPELSSENRRYGVDSLRGPRLRLA